MHAFTGRLRSEQGWAVTRAATLTIGASGLRIGCEDGWTVEASWAGVRIKPSLNRETDVIVEIRDPDGRLHVFETPGAPLLATLGATTPTGPLRADIDALAGQLRTVRRGVGRQVSLVLLALATVVGLFAWSLWTLPDHAIGYIPLAWEETLGESTLARLRNEGEEVKSGPAYDAVHAVWKRLAPSLPPSPYTFRITVVDAPVVNAFAMPGGYVVVYTGLLEELDSPESLAGILGHEAAHVIRKHSLRSMISNMQWRLGLTIFWSLFGGSGDTAVKQMQEHAMELLTLAHSRQHESEADEDGLRTLHRAGIDAAPFGRFFLALSEKEGGRLAILSTHPPSEARAAALDAFRQTLPPARTTPIAVDWKALRRYLRAHPSDAKETGP